MTGLYYEGQQFIAGELIYEPFVDIDGRVGYRVIDPATSKKTFIYFNPSNGEDDRNVFVYEGVENDPNWDGPLHYYDLLERDNHE